MGQGDLPLVARTNLHDARNENGENLEGLRRMGFAAGGWVGSWTRVLRVATGAWQQSGSAEVVECGAGAGTEVPVGEADKLSSQGRLLWAQSADASWQRHTCNGGR